MTCSPGSNNRSIVLLVAHGSSHPGARGALSGFAGRVREMFPGLDVRLAYTATPSLGNHLANLPQPEDVPRQGRPLEQVLAELGRREGFRLVVQSLHVIAGDEFVRTAGVVQGFTLARSLELRLGGPLLGGPGDVDEVALALADSLPQDMAPGEAAVFMGHGTTHKAQTLYLALAERLAGLHAPVFLGVLEAQTPDDPLSLAAIASALRGGGFGSARLFPLLTVSGRHASSDLAGTGPASWKSRLEREGLACRADLAGLVERPRFARLWLDRLTRQLEDSPAAHIG